MLRWCPGVGVIRIGAFKPHTSASCWVMHCLRNGQHNTTRTYTVQGHFARFEDLLCWEPAGDARTATKGAGSTYVASDNSPSQEETSRNISRADPGGKAGGDCARIEPAVQVMTQF